MSRRNQSRRRRSYGRRQHEVRERRIAPDESGLSHDLEPRAEWLSSDNGDEPRGFGQGLGGYLR